MRGLSLIVLFVLLGGCATQMEQQAAYKEAACTTPEGKDLAPIVRVSTADGGKASGVIVSQDRILTAAHVIEDLDLAEVELSDQRSSKAVILAVDTSSDLALLAVYTGNLEPISLSHNQLTQWEPVWAVGFPLATAKKTTHGYFKKAVNDTLHTTADINFGNSGGGLLRCESGRFKLAGMVRGFGAYRSNDGYVKIENLSMSVSAHKINAFMQANGI